MAYPRVEVIEGTYAPTAGATTNLATFVVKRDGAATQVARRIIGFSCRVKRAGNGTGTVSFGTTTGGVASLMSTAEVGGAGPPAARKTTATGADLAGNGTSRAPGAAYEFITGTYTVGTNTVHPVINYRALVVNEDVFDRLMVL